MTWKEYGDLAYYGCAFAAGLFVLVYMTIAPWWRTMTGRNIMAVMFSVASTLIYFAFAIKNKGVPHGFYSVRAVLFSLLFLSLGWRLVILLRAQLGKKEVQHEHSDPMGQVR